VTLRTPAFELRCTTSHVQFICKELHLPWQGIKRDQNNTIYTLWHSARSRYIYYCDKALRACSASWVLRFMRSAAWSCALPAVFCPSATNTMPRW
jgi:hypothetical protein